MTKKLCKVLAIITFLFSLIGAFIIADKIGTNIGEIIGIFVGIAFPSIVLAVILWALSEILDRLDESNDNRTAITQEVSTYKKTENENWECPVCGKKNPLNVKVCECGQESYEEFKKARINKGSP